MLQSLGDALLDGWNEFLGDVAAPDFVVKHELAIGQGLDAQLHARVLAAAAGLFLVGVIVFRGLADGFAVGHLRLADVRAHAEFALHAVDNDFEVQFAHAGENGLARVGVGRNLERGIFLHQFCDGHAQLFLVGLGFGFDGELNHGRREIN